MPPSIASDIEGLDVNFALDMPDGVSEAGPSNEREMWGEDPTIECFELTLRFENLYMGALKGVRLLIGGNIVVLGLVARPISSIHHNDPCVSSMQFFPMIPHAPGEPVSDIPKFPIRLAVNFVDFGDCESSDFLPVCFFLIETQTPEYQRAHWLCTL